MFQQTASIKEFNGLIKVLNSSVDFYQKAMDEVENPKVKTLLGKVHDQHASSIHSLEPYADLDAGEKEDGSSFAVEARNMYTQVLSKLKSDTDLTFIDQLEEVEDKILEKMNSIDEIELPLRAQQAFKKTRMESGVMHNVMTSLQDVREATNNIH